MVKLKTDPALRCFMFTCSFRYADSTAGHFNIELTCSDGKHPDRQEIIELGKIQYAKYHKQKYNSDADLSKVNIMIINIHEFDTSEDYFVWIGIDQSKEEKEE